MVMTMKITVFWDAMVCSFVKIQTFQRATMPTLKGYVPLHACNFYQILWHQNPDNDNLQKSCATELHLNCSNIYVSIPKNQMGRQ